MKAGNLTIILGLVFALGAGYCYYLAASEGRSTLKLARRLTYGMAFMLVSASAILISLILSHQFQVSYVYRYTSRDLPLGYLISAFWAGQEGTFLLWAVLTGLLALIFVRSAKEYESRAMQVILLVEVFFFILLLKQSPFALLERTPIDGAGLNPLLQDPWMVVHPPILFVGYAVLSFPFALAVAALFKRNYSDWTRFAFPWTVFGSLMLGAGIVIGGYWAYEVLGWGGYWGWDPVENSSLIPWLTAIGLFHGLIVQKAKGKLQRTNLFLAIITFLLVLYGTFLTRSGILGDFSVHSFQDNGTNLYLTLFLLGFAGFSLGLFVRRLKEIPKHGFDVSLLTRDNALTLSILALGVSALFTLIGTSSPLLTAMFGSASQVDVSFYNKVNLPIAIVMGVLLGFTPSLGWSPLDLKSFLRRIGIPLVLSILSTAAGQLVGVHDPVDLIFIMAVSFAVWGNSLSLARQFKMGWLTLGAPVAHLGFGLLLVGVLAPSGYDTGEKVALTRDVPTEAMGLTMTYRGKSPLPGGKEALNIEVRKEGKVSETRPKYYYSEYNRAMMREPDIERSAWEDLYVSPLDLREVNSGRPRLGNLLLKKGEEKAIGDYSVRFVGFEMTPHGAGGAIQVGANLAVLYKGRNYRVVPTILITPDGRTAQPATLPSAGEGQTETVTLNALDADKKTVELLFGGTTVPVMNVYTEQLVVELSRKPLINVVWLGTVLFMVGFTLSLVRRSLGNSPA